MNKCICLIRLSSSFSAFDNYTEYTSEKKQHLQSSLYGISIRNYSKPNSRVTGLTCSSSECVLRLYHEVHAAENVCFI